MGFELSIAVKRNPLENYDPKVAKLRAKVSFTEILLNGKFDEAASEAVLRLLTTLTGEGVDSILVVMENVAAGNALCLQDLAAGVMSLRNVGAQVQVHACDAGLHAELRRLPASRDWLLNFTDSSVGGPRRALHLDRSGENH